VKDIIIEPLGTEFKSKFLRLFVGLSCVPKKLYYELKQLGLQSQNFKGVLAPPKAS